MRITRKGKYWLVETGKLVAEVAPMGGKIRRLISAASGRDFFFQDPRRRFRGPDYIQHDISGFDECFPTVGKAPGRFGQDHGLLWDRVWTVQPERDSLLAWVERPGGIPVRFERRICSPRPATLRLEYSLKNLSRKPLPFIYSSHPILALEPGSKISLPGVDHLAVLGHNGLLKAGRRQSWPAGELAGGAKVRLDTDFRADRALAGKWFARRVDRARITFPGSREALGLRWDRQALPYLGIWLSLGIPLAAGSRPGDWVCAALEPCTYPHDILDPKKNQALAPAGVLSFWIEWEITASDIRSGSRRRHEHRTREAKTP